VTQRPSNTGKTEQIVDTWAIHHDQPEFRSRLVREYLVRVFESGEHERDVARGLSEPHDYVFNGSNSPSMNPPYDAVELSRHTGTHLFDLRTGYEINRKTRRPLTDDPAIRRRIVPEDLRAVRKVCGRDDLSEKG